MKNIEKLFILMNLFVLINASEKADIVKSEAGRIHDARIEIIHNSMEGVLIIYKSNRNIRHVYGCSGHGSYFRNSERLEGDKWIFFNHEQISQQEFEYRKPAAEYFLKNR